MNRFPCARGIAGVFLFSAVLPALCAAPLKIAAERPDAACPAGARIAGIIRLEKTAPLAAAVPCVALFSVSDLGDAALNEAASRLSRLPSTDAVVLDFSSVADAARDPRLPLAVKRLASAARSVFPAPLVGLDLPASPSGLPADSDLSAYADAAQKRPLTR